MSGQGKVLDVQLVQLVKEKGEGGKKERGEERKGRTWGGEYGF